MAKANNTAPVATVNTSAGATGVGPLALTASSAKRYGAKAHNLKPQQLAATFTLNTTGLSYANAGGRVASGKYNLMAITALAIHAASNGGQSATASAVIATMQTPYFVGLLAQTKGNGHHVTANTPPPAQLVWGYLNGLCRASGALGIIASRA